MEKIIDISLLIPLINEAFEAGIGFSFYPSGISMKPTIDEKIDSVTIIKAKRIRTGDIVLYCRPNGKYILHRCVGRLNGKLIMCGDNQKSLEYPVSESDVIGIISKITKCDRVVLCRQLSFRIKSFFYVHRLFWRKFKLFVRRNILTK